MSDLFKLVDRVALVTGAGSGIGRATALVLRELGAQVVVTDIDAAALDETLGLLGKAPNLALRHDVTSQDDWTAVIDQIAARCGRLDVLINNAGIMIRQAFVDTTLDQLRKQLRINVEGPFIGMQAAIPLMQRSIAQFGAKPAIVNVSSIYGRVAGERYAAYSASKGAVLMLSRAAATELATVGIRVNSVKPGPTVTNLTATWGPERDKDGNITTIEDIAQRILSQIPVGQMAQPREIASVIAFLACDASQYITGSEFVVDGGYTAV